MRILHLLASPFFSGPAENVALLAAAQRALGHEVAVAVDRKRSDFQYEEPAVPRFKELGLLDESGLELCTKSMPWRMVADALSLRQREVDVVHAHFSHDHYVARWGRPARSVLVRSIHAPRSLRGSMPFAQGWTVPSEREASRISGRVVVLPPMAGPQFVPAADRAALQRELGVEGEPVIGMVSNFQPSRRHGLGVEAFKTLRKRAPSARLVMVGNGPLFDEVKAQAGSEPVVFAGYQSGSAFVRWLQAMDVVWILGLGNDYSGRAAAQARASGVRVIATTEGALPEWADEVVAELTPEAIASATLGGARRSVPLPDSKSVAEKVLELYRSCGVVV